MNTPNTRKKLGYHERCQAERGLIEHEQAGPCHEPPANGEHLLFAATQRAGHLVLAFAQAWKQIHDVGQALPTQPAGAPGERPQLQILQHSHV
jgi:hypothetical protein